MDLQDRKKYDDTEVKPVSTLLKFKLGHLGENATC